MTMVVNHLSIRPDFLGGVWVSGNFLIEILVDQWGLARERRSQGSDLQQGTDEQKFGNTIETSNS